MMKVVRGYTERKHWKERKTSFAVMQEIMLQFAYPRSAIHSKKINKLTNKLLYFLLKSCSAFFMLHSPPGWISRCPRG